MRRTHYKAKEHHKYYNRSILSSCTLERGFFGTSCVAVIVVDPQLPVFWIAEISNARRLAYMASSYISLKG